MVVLIDDQIDFVRARQAVCLPMSPAWEAVAHALIEGMRAHRGRLLAEEKSDAPSAVEQLVGALHNIGALEALAAGDHVERGHLRASRAEAALLQQHLKPDRCGVTIGVRDVGVNLPTPALQKTTTGERKGVELGDRHRPDHRRRRYLAADDHLSHRPHLHLRLQDLEGPCGLVPDEHLARRRQRWWQGHERRHRR